MHEKTTTFRCEICGKSFINKANLARHIGVVHEGKKAYKCEICDDRFSQKGTIKDMLHQFMKE